MLTFTAEKNVVLQGGIEDPGDRELAWLLKVVGGGLVSLRLAGSFVVDGVVRAIATFCTSLRELDMG